MICSVARRTRQTWELVAPELGGSPSVTFEPRAYAASALTLLYLARELPASCRAALLIGHNPAIEELASSLAEPPAADGAPPSPGLRFPTAAVAVLEFDADWPTWPPASRLLPSPPPPTLQSCRTALMGTLRDPRCVGFGSGGARGRGRWWRAERGGAAGWAERWGGAEWRGRAGPVTTGVDDL